MPEAARNHGLLFFLPRCCTESQVTFNVPEGRAEEGCERHAEPVHPDVVPVYLQVVSTMGMFQIRVRVSNPSDRSRFFEENFWVDAGALYSFVPEGRLSEIGISPLRARELVMADGRRDRRLLGEAVFTISQLNESMTCPVIFAPAGSLYLLGGYGARELRRAGGSNQSAVTPDRRGDRRLPHVCLTIPWI